MKAPRWPGVILTLWAAALLMILCGLLIAPAGLAGAPAPDYIPASRVIRLAVNSLYTAAGAALLSFLLMLLPAFSVARLVPARWVKWLAPLALAPLFVSPTVIAVAGVHILGPQGWMTRAVSHVIFALTGNSIYDPREPQALPSPIYTLTGVVICLAWSFLPVAFVAFFAAFRGVNRSVEETALLEASPLQVFRRITLPLASPGIFAGVLLVFLLALLEFGVPESLRNQPVLVTEIYTQLGINYNVESSYVAAGTLGALALLVTRLVLLRLSRAFPRDGLLEAASVENGASPFNRHFRFLAWPGLALLVMPFGFLFATLLIRLNGADGPLGTLAKTWILTRDEFWFTMAIALQGALLTAIVGVLLGAAIAKLQKPFAARMMALFGFFMPASVTAVALKMILLWPPHQLPAALDHALVWLDGSYVPLVFAYVLRFAPLVALLTEMQLRLVSRDLVDATRLESNGLIAALRGWAGGPLLLAAIPGFLIALALITGESGATILLIPPGKTMLAVRLLTLMHFAPTAQVSALCLLMCIPSLIILPMIVVAWEKFTVRENLHLSSTRNAQR